MKFGFGSKSRCRRVVQDSSMAAAAAAQEAEIGGASRQSSFADFPQELLREVLMRVEASESSWPSRRNVVACAGVCRRWREVVREFVGTPEVSGKFTFPVSVKQPGRRDNLIQCFIRRNRMTQTYRLYLSLTLALAEHGKFLLAARKFKRPTCTDYNISLNTHDMSRGRSTYIGKLRSNFLRTKFVVYDDLPPCAGALVMSSHLSKLLGSKQLFAGSCPVAHISYELNVLGSRGPRRMQCLMDAIPAAAVEPGGMAPTQTELPLSNMDSSSSLPFFKSKSSRVENFLCGPSTEQRDERDHLVLKNKAPRWNEQLQCWCLNFHGRVTVASVKNFQLVASIENGQAAGPERGKVILQFGKVGKDLFTMDYRYPLSAFQAFAICLSSFDTKIACE